MLLSFTVKIPSPDVVSPDKYSLWIEKDKKSFVVNTLEIDSPDKKEVRKVILPRDMLFWRVGPTHLDDFFINFKTPGAKMLQIPLILKDLVKAFSGEDEGILNVHVIVSYEASKALFTIESEFEKYPASKEIPEALIFNFGEFLDSPLKPLHDILSKIPTALANKELTSLDIACGIIGIADTLDRLNTYGALFLPTSLHPKFLELCKKCLLGVEKLKAFGSELEVRATLINSPAYQATIQSLLFECLKSDDSTVLVEVLSAQKLSPLSPCLTNALFKAVELGKSKCLKELVQHGDVCASNDDYKIPLHLAIIHSNPECVKILLEAPVSFDRTPKPDFQLTFTGPSPSPLDLIAEISEPGKKKEIIDTIRTVMKTHEKYFSSRIGLIQRVLDTIDIKTDKDRSEVSLKEDLTHTEKPSQTGTVKKLFSESIKPKKESSMQGSKNEKRSNCTMF